MKVSLIGAGLQGWRRAKALSEAGDDLVMVADLNINSARKLARVYACETTRDWKVAISHPKVETVIVCTPNNTHAPISIAAAKSMRNVFCEKPLARNPTEAAGIVNVVKKMGVRLMCGFTLRHHPGVIQVKKWVDAGEIGEPMHLRCTYGITGRPGYDREWRMQKSISGGGQLMDQGIHVLDLILWFFGELDEATGHVTTSFWKKATVEDNAFFILASKDKTALGHVSWTEWKNLFSLKIFGTHGYANVRGLGGSYGIECATLGKRDFESPFTETKIEYRKESRALIEEWKEFTRAIRENREPLGNGSDGLMAIRLAYAIYESSRKHRTVKIR